MYKISYCDIPSEDRYSYLWWGRELVETSCLWTVVIDMTCPHLENERHTLLKKFKGWNSDYSQHINVSTPESFSKGVTCAKNKYPYHYIIYYVF